jgi:hypothetical protein
LEPENDRALTDSAIPADLARTRADNESSRLRCRRAAWYCPTESPPARHRTAAGPGPTECVEYYQWSAY